MAASRRTVRRARRVSRRHRVSVAAARSRDRSRRVRSHGARPDRAGLQRPALLSRPGAVGARLASRLVRPEMEGLRGGVRRLGGGGGVRAVPDVRPEPPRRGDGAGRRRVRLWSALHAARPVHVGSADVPAGARDHGSPASRACRAWRGYRRRRRAGEGVRSGAALHRRGISRERAPMARRRACFRCGQRRVHRLGVADADADVEIQLLVGRHRIGEPFRRRLHRAWLQRQSARGARRRCSTSSVRCGC